MFRRYPSPPLILLSIFPVISVLASCQTRRFGAASGVRQTGAPLGLNERLMPESSDWHMGWEDSNSQWNARWQAWLAAGGIPADRNQWQKLTSAKPKLSLPFPQLYNGEGKKISFEATSGNGSPKVARSLWYNVPQGSYLIPAALLFALQKDGKPFAHAENMLQYGFIYPPGYQPASGGEFPAKSSEYSFMGLPLGMVPEISERDGVKGAISIGPTCAACHTGEMYADVSAQGRKTNGRTRVVVDGGQPMLEFSRFLLDLSAELQKVKVDLSQNTSSGQEFCMRAQRAEQGMKSTQSERWKNVKSFYDSFDTCRNHLVATADYLADRLNRNGFAPRRSGLVEEGPGRLDALAQLVNELTIYHLGLKPNDQVKPVTPAAPISYPHLWTAPDMECVQTNCLTSDPLTRNLGEVSGVFGIIRIGSEQGDKAFMTEMGLPEALSGKIATFVAGLPKNKAFPPISATGSPVNMFILEDALKTLPSPQWSALFDTRISVKEALWQRGKAIFEDRKYNVTTSHGKQPFASQDHSCASCHVRKYAPDAGNNFAMKLEPEENWLADPGMSTDPNQGKFIRAIKIRQDVIGTDPSFLTQATGHSIPAEHLPASLLLAYSALVGQTLVNNIRGDVTESLQAFFSRESEVSQALESEIEQLPKNEQGSASKLAELRNRIKNVPSLAAFGIVNTFSVRSWSKKNNVSKADRDQLSHHHAFVRPLDVKVYKARPLDGVAFSSPYFHNGSVPTLEEFFKVPAERISSFTPVTLEYDATRIGYRYPETVSEVPLSQMINSRKSDGTWSFVLDTKQEGNLNQGHIWGTELSSDDKLALIEYLKTL